MGASDIDIHPAISHHLYQQLPLVHVRLLFILGEQDLSFEVSVQYLQQGLCISCFEHARHPCCHHEQRIVTVNH